jgi:hypothetical protein
LSSDFGPLLLHSIDRQIGMTARLAAAVYDKRHPSYIDHPLAIDGAPAPTVLGDKAPLTSCLVDIQEPVNDTVHGAWEASGSTRAPCACGQQGVEQLPWCISYICWRVMVGTHGWSSQICA